MQTGHAEVLILEHGADFGELLAAVLRAEGHDAAWALPPDDIVEMVAARQPDLVVVNLDTQATPKTPYWLLDALRSDPRTGGVSVMGLTFDPYLAGAALASYNVRAAVVKPFSVPGFVEQVVRTLRYPPVYQPQRTAGSSSTGSSTTGSGATGRQRRRGAGAGGLCANGRLPVGAAIADSASLAG